jgi:hypothetical protein
MLADDAHGVVEAETEALAGRFRSEKRFEDAVLEVFRDLRAVVPDFHQNHVGFKLADDAQAAFLLRIGAAVDFGQRFDGVFDEDRPNLIQFAAVGADGGQIRLILADDVDARSM